MTVVARAKVKMMKMERIIPFKVFKGNVLNEIDEVKKGDKLLVLEAMKMENIIRAQRDGKIASIEASVGEALEVDQCIARLEKVVAD